MKTNNDPYLVETPLMPAPAVIVDGLTKTYGKKNEILAVDNVSFSVNQGELFGLIGPDGSGKTSLFRMLTTLLLPNSGKASVDGYDIVSDYKKIRNSVGYMPGKFSLYQDLTVEENLQFFATIFNTTIAENYYLIKDIYIQIEKFKDRKAGKLSGGMKQKLALCCALIHKPAVLFLDEPTTGVDPVSRKEFWEMLRKLKEQQITIIVSTPYMDEATLCDRIALIQEGKILDVDSPAKIIQAYPDKLYAVKAADMYLLLKNLREYENTANAYAFGEFAHISFQDNIDAEQNLISFLQNQKMKDIEIHRIEPTIEDVFIKRLTNK